METQIEQRAKQNDETRHFLALPPEYTRWRVAYVFEHDPRDDIRSAPTTQYISLQGTPTQVDAQWSVVAQQAKGREIRVTTVVPDIIGTAPDA
jgi:hypothetical protein